MRFAGYSADEGQSWSRGRLARSAIALAAAVAASDASACYVCVALPERTLTERIWDAEAVVLARPAPDAPYTYAVLRVLAGEPGAGIPILVDSVTRHRMARDPEHAVLALREGETGWRLVAQGGPALAALVGEILTNKRGWTDETDDPDRLHTFAALHDHPDTDIRRLALTELARASYVQLRGIEVRLPTAWLTGRLAEPAWQAWRPIMVLLLGMSDDPAAAELVRAEAAQGAQRFAAPDRAAWLVAAIEVDGVDAVERLSRTAEGITERRALVDALVVHASASPEWSEALSTALRDLARLDPALAAAAAPGLTALEDDALAPHVARLLAEDRVADPAAEFALKAYLAGSRSGFARVYGASR